MSFKLRALVLTAIATATLSGAANALTNNEMFLVAYDSTASKTFVAALGGAGSVSAFTGGTNLSVNYGSDANWTNFMSGATASNISYQVIGFYSSNTAQATSYNANDKIVTTTNMTSLPLLRNSAYNNLMADMVSGAGINGGFQALNSAVTGTSTAMITGSGSDSGAAVGSNLFTKYNAFDATAALGTDLGFYSITRGATSGNTIDSIKTQYLQGGVASAIDAWNLSSSGVLTYTAVAAVPEADTSAMMIAGIGLMAFIARRRKTA